MKSGLLVSILLALSTLCRVVSADDTPPLPQTLRVAVTCGGGARLLRTPRLTGPGGQVGNLLGYGENTMSIQGNVLVAGAENDGEDRKGRVYVYRFSTSGGWEAVQTIVPPAQVKYFGSSVALSGDWLAIATSSVADRGGAVFLYQTNAVSGEWELRQSIYEIAGESSYYDGAVNVSLRGNQLLISTVDHYTAGSVVSISAVSFYSLTSPETTDPWVFEQRFIPTDINFTLLYNFGYSVGLGDGVAIVGAPGAGIVYLLSKTGTGVEPWEVRRRFPTTGAGGYWYGFRAVAEGKTVAFSSPKDGNGKGAVFVYEGSEDWALEHRLEIEAPATGQIEFGFGLALRGDRLAVTSVVEDASPERSAAVFLFNRDSNRANKWREVAFDVPPPADVGGWTANFGYDVVMNDSQLLTSAPARSAEEPGFERLHGAIYPYLVIGASKEIGAELTIRLEADGGVTLGVVIEPGMTRTIQVSHDLLTWTNLISVDCTFNEVELPLKELTIEGPAFFR